MRGAACLLVLVVAAVVCGCSGSSTAGRECSGGTVDGDHCVAYTLDQKAAFSLAQMPVPPRNGKPLTDIDCHVSGQVADCSGVTQAGHRVHAEFKLASTSPSSRMLVPICNGTHPRNIFCAE